MRLTGLICFLPVLFCGAVYADMRNVCVNGICHVVTDHRNSAYVDGRMRTANRFRGNVSADGKHAFKSADSSSLIQDKSYRHRLDLGGMVNDNNDELYNFDVH
jgi:hypothetical protein